MAKVLILGASGQTGAALADLLWANGYSVFAATRGGRPLPVLLHGKVEPVQAEDRSLADILAQTGPVDALFDPLIYTPEQAQTVLGSGHRYGRLITLSSASLYADDAGRSLETDDFPHFTAALAEDQATVPPGPLNYSTRKAAMEQVLLNSPHPVSILRPCAIHGRYARHPREWWLIKRALDGRGAIPVAYQGQSRFHTTSAAGIASLAALCLERPGTHVLNVGDRQAHSITEIAAILATQLGRAIPLAPFPGPPLGHIGASPWSVPLPFTLDCAAATALGWSAPAYADGVVDYVPWLVATAARGDWRTAFAGFSDYGHDPFNYSAEDDYLTGLAGGS